MKHRVTVRQYVEKLRPTLAGYKGYLETPIDVDADDAIGAREAALEIFEDRYPRDRWKPLAPPRVKIEGDRYTIEET